MNIVTAQSKPAKPRYGLLLRGLLGFYVYLFSFITHAALYDPSPFFLNTHVYQFTYQNDVQLLYQLERFKEYPEAMHEPAPSFAEESAEWLIETRDEWSSMIGNTGAQLDLFFAGEEVQYKENASYIRLALEANYTKSGELSFDPVFKFKLDLPTLKKRLKLVVESNLPEQDTLSDTKIDRSLQDEDLTLARTTGTFQYLLGTVKNWEASTSAGVRINRELNPFWRMRIKRAWHLNHAWEFKTLLSLYYFHEDSWGESTKFIFERPIGSYFFASKSQLRWKHNQRLLEYAKIFSVKKKLSEIRAINYELGVLAQNQPNIIVTDYFVKTTYRRMLYKDWLFYEASPELLFSSEGSFKAKPSILMRIEMRFSNL